MTDTPIVVPKPRRAIRKGTPPKPDETLGALATPAAAAKAAKPAARKAAPAKPAKPKPAAASRAPAQAEQPASAPVPPAEAKPAKAEKPAKPASERTKPLNFRVTNEFRKAFKQAAAAEDCKKVELLERIFADWQAARPR